VKAAAAVACLGHVLWCTFNSVAPEVRQQWLWALLELDVDSAAAVLASPGHVLWSATQWPSLSGLHSLLFVSLQLSWHTLLHQPPHFLFCSAALLMLFSVVSPAAERAGPGGRGCCIHSIHSCTNQHTACYVLLLLLQLSEQDLVAVAAAGRLLMARPYGSRMNHSQGLASAMAAAQV
jgi:hypothetical protein